MVSFHFLPGIGVVGTS